jgi:hypothetical protein
MSRKRKIDYERPVADILVKRLLNDPNLGFLGSDILSYVVNFSIKEMEVDSENLVDESIETAAGPWSWCADWFSNRNAIPGKQTIEVSLLFQLLGFCVECVRPVGIKGSAVLQSCSQPVVAREERPSVRKAFASSGKSYCDAAERSLSFCHLLARTEDRLREEIPHSSSDLVTALSTESLPVEKISRIEDFIAEREGIYFGGRQSVLRLEHEAANRPDGFVFFVPKSSCNTVLQLFIPVGFLPRSDPCSSTNR